MKASELMIGDWVMDGDVAARVTSLTCDGIIETTLRISNVEVVELIPLTAEILEKNFQELLPGINLMYQLKGPYCVMNEDENQWVFGLVKNDGENSGRYPLVKIAFIHELQHALRMCGIDKTIEL